MTKPRIQVYTDAETKRRVAAAAAKHNMPITAYCLAAIQRQLADDERLEANGIAPPTPTNGKDNTGEEDTLIADLRALHQEILADRGGQLIDVDYELEQMRSERDDELTGLR